MSLTSDQAAQVENNTLSLISLAEYGDIGVLKGSKLLLVAFPLTLEFLGNFLLENKSLESIVTLLLSSRKTSGQASGIILLLVNETSKASVLALVVLDLDLEILGLLGELFGERLELEELLDG